VSDRAGLLRWGEVETGAIEHNAAAVRSWLGRPTRLMAMVKANAYGHGAVRSATAALRGGATWLGVYTPQEALELRGAGIDEPLLVAGYSPREWLAALVDAQVDVTVFDEDSVRALASVGTAQRSARCHVKVDTGLGRLGFAPHQIAQLAKALRSVDERVHLAGVFTHFADTAQESVYTTQQHAVLLEAVEALRPVAPELLTHAAGTAAIVHRPETHHDMVRAGIALYGYTPPGVHPPTPLRPAMTVFARIVQVKTVPAGAFVGYGRTWRAESERVIATAAIGYAQGVPRALSNRGHMLVHGARCPIAGTVSMDQVTLDVSDAGPVRQGDVAMFFGECDGVRLDAAEVGEAAQSIAYEVICRAGASVECGTVSR